MPGMVTCMGRVVTPLDNERLDTPARIRLLAEILSSYCSVRWWLLRLNFPQAVAAARDVRPDGPVGLSDAQLRSAGLRLGNAVQRTLRPLPVDSRCLVTAVVLTRMLARRGIDSSFVLGVRSRPGFAAHAWVERGGVALLPTATEFQRLRVI